MAVYLLNRSPPRSTPHWRTPIQEYFDTKPSLEHIRIFGCKVLTHVSPEIRQKLDPKMKQGVFIGYVNHSTEL